MRTLFLIFLMAILPFQFSWSAASSYCQHENTVKAALHFGHHSHIHQIDPADQDSSSKHNKKNHLDCSFCHVSHVVADLPLFPAASFQSRIEVNALNAVDSPLAYTSHISNGLDRPDWRLAS